MISGPAALLLSVVRWKQDDFECVRWMSKHSKPAVPQVTPVLYILKEKKKKKKKATFWFYQLDWPEKRGDYVQNKASGASSHVQN